MGYILYILCFLLSWIAVRHVLSLISRRQRNLPPGPSPLPIIGNLLSIGDKPHESLSRLAHIYGPVIYLQLGSKKTVVVSSPAAAKEVLQKHDSSFSYRTVPDSLRACRQSQLSMGWLPPHAEWRNIRKITHSQVFSSSVLDANSHIRQQKMNDLLSQVDDFRKVGMAVDIGHAAFITTMNLLSSTLFSVDLAHQQPGSGSRIGFKDLVTQIMFEAGKPNLSDYFPVFKWLDLQGIRGRMEVHLGKLLDLIDDMIDKRLESVKGKADDPSAGDALDALLKITRGDKSEGFDRVYLRHMLVDLFIAGTDTTSSTLEWAMAELLHNPIKMKKLQQELENVIGKDNQVKEGDISRLPYLQAVIKETCRLHPPGPLLIPRKAGTDVELCGFMVPKNSQVLVNVWSIGRDPSIWNDASMFLPERFLGSNIDLKGQDFELLPFGAGRRICPGMPLAIRSLPMTVASLIHSFDWRLNEGVTPENMDMREKIGLTLQKAQPLMAIPMMKL